MVFNRGRHEAHRSAHVAPEALAAASCVGHAGDRVVVHALLTDADVVSIENPRQTPAWRYSSRFGPRPPSFARAVRVDGASGAVIVSGTASVLGEETVHPESLARQLLETRCNLEAIVSAARPGATFSDVGHARIYVTDAAARAPARDAFAALGGNGEVLVAPLCRRNLLVEVEAYVPAVE
jgi:chorismate lyase/3-hydroxybenzoate synthase